jgi:hypothetical protein
MANFTRPTVRLQQLPQVELSFVAFIKHHIAATRTQRKKLSVIHIDHCERYALVHNNYQWCVRIR